MSGRGAPFVRWAALAAMFGVACGGAATPPPAPPPPLPQASATTGSHPTATTGDVVAQQADVASISGGPRFDDFAGLRAGSLSTLFYTFPTVIRAHTSGDVVIAGCTEAPSALTRPGQDGTHVFVARVEPLSGTMRWARTLRTGRGAFENSCRAYRQVPDAQRELSAAPQLVMGDDGSIYLAALIEDDPELSLGSPSAGTVVLSLDATDGGTRWQQVVARNAEPVVVAHLLSDGVGVAAIVRRGAPDAVDGYSLVRVDAVGRLGEIPLLSVRPNPQRRVRCFSGPSGCDVDISFVSRVEDGSLLLYGTSRGVEVGLGPRSIRSAADGVRAEGFWAVIERDGSPRWIRGGAPIFPTVMRTEGHHVVAVLHSATHVESVVSLDPEHGTRRPWTGAEPSWPIARTLELHEAVRRRLDGGTLMGDTDTLPLAPAATDPLTPDSLRRLAEGDPDASPSLARMRGGAPVAIRGLLGTLRLAGATTRSAIRMVPCHPGPVGEEHSMPPDCREPLIRWSAVLFGWPDP